MNRLLPLIIATILLVVFSTLAASAQGGNNEFHLTVTVGQEISIPVNSEGNPPLIIQQPTYGSAYFEGTGSDRIGLAGADVIVYTPPIGYVGTETITARVSGGEAGYQDFYYILDIQGASVNLEDDLVSTSYFKAVTVDVLKNDYASLGQLNLSSIRSVSVGEASIRNNKLQYTPEYGFTGQAYVDYEACDYFGNCGVGQLTVLLGHRATRSDTFALQVAKNDTLEILYDLYAYRLDKDVEHGSYIDGRPSLYLPSHDFIGSDQLIFAGKDASRGVFRVFNIEVLDVETPNEYAQDDQAYTAVNTAAYIDVLRNDNRSDDLRGLELNESPRFGSVHFEGNLMVYTPNEDFRGDDAFTYQVYPPNFSSQVEIATVNVSVSDYTPDLLEFTIESPKNTPLVLEYPIAYTNYAFGIDDPLPSSGTAAFHSSIDTTVRGYTISGNRVIIYNPEDDFVGQDKVRANYCITTTGRCVGLDITVNVTDHDAPNGGWCVQECVWPGDTDNNGIVELADLLPIGVTHGTSGINRYDVQEGWIGHEAKDWEDVSQRQRDLKYIDANGDGLISAADTAAILENLGKYHNPYRSETRRFSTLPFYIEVPFDTIYAGEKYSISIYLGSENYYAEDIYGFTFDFNYNTNFVRPESGRLTFLENSWLNYGTTDLSLVHKVREGHLSSAYTRLDRKSVNGHGEIAKFDFIGDVDLIGFRDNEGYALENPDEHAEKGETVIGFADFNLAAGAVVAGGQKSQITASTLSIPVAYRPENLALQNRDISISPNPSFGRTRLHVNGTDVLDDVLIVDELGRTIQRFQDVPNSFTFSTEQFTPGAYFVRITANKSTQTKRLIVQ